MASRFGILPPKYQADRPLSPPPPPVPRRRDSLDTIRRVQLAYEAAQSAKKKKDFRQFAKAVAEEICSTPERPTPPSIKLLCSWCMQPKCNCRRFFTWVLAVFAVCITAELLAAFVYCFSKVGMK